ncbi:tyrosine-protein phosphatase [Lentibacillus halodurans]|nr:CpsB/CapC family capsule biosynthesis tyrosine phosphatase [Lentibacillus halodurans]
MHCHILPGLDDGPKLLKETIAMAKTAASQGIVTIIATPHHNNGRYINEKVHLVGATDFMNAELEQLRIPVEILPGQEIHMYEEMVNDLEHGILLPLNQSTKYVLIDLQDRFLPPFTLRLLFDLQIAGYIPVIAHPERNNGVISNPDILYDMVKNGALVQADASSIVGGNGKKARKLTREMLDANLVHFIASNAHQAKNDQLGRAYRSLDSGTADLLQENSELLINNRPIAKHVPSRLAKKRFRKFLN